MRRGWWSTSAVIWLAHPALGMAAALAAVVMLALALLNDFLTRRDIESLQKAAGGATRYLEASLQNAEVAQAMGMTDALLGRWRAEERRGHRAAGPDGAQVGADDGHHAHGAAGACRR